MPAFYGSKFNAMKHADTPHPSPRFFMFFSGLSQVMCCRKNASFGVLDRHGCNCDPACHAAGRPASAGQAALGTEPGAAKEPWSTTA
jgi:hypothetical protein